MKDLQKPCKECAFSRSSTPGALGGSPAEVYIGQCFGPFFIPCHMTYEENNEELRQNLHCTGGCAGSAVFRANCGWDQAMPKGVNKLPADHEEVFSSPVEFLAHHKQITLFEAMNQLMHQNPAELLRIEMSKAGMRLLNADRTPKRD